MEKVQQFERPWRTWREQLDKLHLICPDSADFIEYVELGAFFPTAS
ncbi:hypothetical protein MKY96_09185 [Paenibacillus sp. FSL R7-0302]